MLLHACLRPRQANKNIFVTRARPSTFGLNRTEHCATIDVDPLPVLDFCSFQGGFEHFFGHRSTFLWDFWCILVYPCDSFACLSFVLLFLSSCSSHLLTCSWFTCGTFVRLRDLLMISKESVCILGPVSGFSKLMNIYARSPGALGFQIIPGLWGASRSGKHTIYK